MQKTIASRPVALSTPAWLAPAVLLAAGFALVAITVVFWFLWPPVAVLWPFPLTNGTFLAAIAASIAAPVFLIVATGDYGVVKAGAITLGVTFAGFAIVVTPFLGQNPALWPFLAVYLVAVAGNALMFRWGGQFPLLDQRPTPRPVLLAFAVIAVLLIVPGGLSMLGIDAMPFPQRPGNLGMYGAIYVGSGAFFVWALARPVWSNAKPQLLAFLVYDLVRLPVVLPGVPRMLADPSAFRLSAWIYDIAVFSSLILTLVYLVILPEWRLWRASGRPDPSA
jgi:hypothetical protein